MKNVYHHHIHRVKIGIRPEHGRETLFLHDTPDDEWMECIGSREWIAISQDYRLHRQPSVLSIIKQYRVKVFYLWGASETKQEVMRTFLNSHRKIIDMAAAHSGPYVFRVKRRGPLERFM